jgi:eukaryotic-like serine/threonine-protein kinase
MVEGAVLTGRYRLGRRLATGGMGAVFEGIDERLNRTVAVKLLKDEFVNDPRFVERFRREARAVASLSHPHIASVYDYGEDTGKHFIVMELVSGSDLAQILRTEGALPVERAVRIGVQLCRALASAHAAGVIHRDIKPANIIVGDDDRVRVTDFGIARAIGDATLTATGSILGTAHYVSPEQARGDDLTFASDLYSAGIVMYEMLTGEVPFPGESAIAIAMRHMHEDVPTPSRLNPAVSASLDRVVTRATARDPSARWSSAQEMEQALENSVSAPTRRASLAQPPPPDRSGEGVWPIPGDHLNPHRVGRVLLLVFAGLALLAGAVIAIRLAARDETPDPGRDRSNASSGGGLPAQETPPEEEPTPEPTPTPTPSGIVIAEEFIGSDSKDVEKLLREQGVIVETLDQDSEEEKHTVIDVQPPPGTTVAAGDTVTLIMSTGKVKKEEGDD